VGATVPRVEIIPNADLVSSRVSDMYRTELNWLTNVYLLYFCFCR